MKRLVRGEKGYVLIAALLVLVVLGLISGPLLSYMVSGLRAGHVFETGTAELYAADAGVEDAVWKIQHPVEAGYLPCSPGNPPRVYNITDVNGKVVEVTIEYAGEGDYRITSIAVTEGGGNTAGLGSHTTVEAYVGVTTMVASGFLDNAITSNGTVAIGSNCIVNGNVTYGTGISGNNSQSLNGTPTQGYLTWPTCGELSSYYLNNVTGAPDICSGTSCTINVGGGMVTKGPVYREGDLHIDGTGGILKLTGTIYVTGSLYCDQSGQGYTVDLNGQTIFVLGIADFPANHVIVKGSGCIIACGDINFLPGIVTNSDDFVFVMSATGKLNFQPNGNFYGSVAGDVDVNLQPGNTLTWHSLGGTSLNVPASISGSGMKAVTGATITSYSVSRQ